MRAIAVLAFALLALGGCSLVFGTSRHVAQYDAGTDDAGLDAR